MPSEPVSIAAQSLSRSPNRLAVTITSNCLGRRTSCHRAIVGVHVLQLDVRIVRRVQRRHLVAPELPDSITLALSTECTRLSRRRASSKATRQTRSISGAL